MFSKMRSSSLSWDRRNTCEKWANIPLALLFPLLENHFITIEMQIQIVVRYPIINVIYINAPNHSHANSTCRPVDIALCGATL